MRSNILVAVTISGLLSAFPICACAQGTQQAAPNYQNQNTQPNVATAQVQGNTPDARTMAPEWYSNMTPEHRKFLVDLLDYWQRKSAEVKRYKCEFTRYDYDTTFCNWRDPKTNQLAAASIMQGEIRFAAPDQACYETRAVYDFSINPQTQKPDYKQRTESSNKEKWICDGKAIHEFDYANKKLYETLIPLEMQGKGLAHSPIPFLFGASKEDILNRFWIRVTTPDTVKNEYWLEAVPKKIDDARNYKKLELVLSRDELFLPIMLHIYAPNYNPKENNLTSRVFEFQNRQKNSKLSGIQDFFKWFVRPATPPGFERVKRQSLQAHQQFDRSRLTRPAHKNSGTQIK